MNGMRRPEETPINTLSRHGFVAASAAALATAQMLRLAFAQTATPIALSAAPPRRLSGDQLGLSGPRDQGLTFDPGQRFRVGLTNHLYVPTIVHWHGQTSPNVQDDAPNTAPLMNPGEMRPFDFEATIALSDPEVAQVGRGGRIGLRVINASAAMVFWIDRGGAGPADRGGWRPGATVERHVLRSGDGAEDGLGDRPAR